jgi:mRNA interferase RelE/StbE
MRKLLGKYKLIYTKSAVKDIKKLDGVAKVRIKNKIELYSQNPLHYAKKLVNSYIGEYRWRFGKYRLIFDLKGNSIIILRIGHRREVYKYAN